MNALLKLDQISLAYDGNTVVDGISLALDAGEIGCLLGPSGCGKTSLLRAISGFEPVQQGSIFLQDRLLSNPAQRIPPEQRNIGMVFQDFALFPHLNVADNIAFGLHRMPAEQRRQRVAELLTLTRLESYTSQYPHQLSGGQQQRVALARAMAPKPEILLLDEPFSNIDTDLREQLAAEVRNILKSEQITAVLVTHDQMEAFAMADKIAVLGQGTLQQWGTADDIYRRPNNRFVAEFIGHGTVLSATVLDRGRIQTELGPVATEAPVNLPAGKTCHLLLRPDQVMLDPASSVRASIVDRRFRGQYYFYTLQAGTLQLTCLSDAAYPVGQDIGISLVVKSAIVI